MDLDKARAINENMKREVAEMELALTQDFPPKPSIIATSEEFKRAYSQASAGDTILLDPSFVSSEPLHLDKAITLRCSTDLPDARIEVDRPLPMFLAGALLGGGSNILGVEFRHTDPLTDVVRFGGADIKMDRYRVMGDRGKGAKRGINANGDGNMKIWNGYVEDCFATYPGNDSQAIYCGNAGPGLEIINNRLSAGSETLLIGGEDPPSADRIPTNVVVRRNTITKRPEWIPLPIGSKNCVEVKNCKNLLFEENDCSYAWGQIPPGNGGGQDGFLLVLTVRNQDGRAPFSTIKDVIIRNNKWAHGANAINILGRDDIKEDKPNRDVPIGVIRRSEPMSNVKIVGRNIFDDLDPGKYNPGKVNKMILFGGGPIGLTIDENDFKAASMHSSMLYFSGGPQAEGFMFTRNVYPKSTYGMFGAGVSSSKLISVLNPAWQKYVVNGICEANLLA